MKYAPILMLSIGSQLVMTCGTSNVFGNLNVDRLPQNVREECPEPETVIIGYDTDWKLIAGRLGAELIECGQEKKIAVLAHDELAVILSGNDKGE